jgi:phage-related protein
MGLIPLLVTFSSTGGARRRTASYIVLLVGTRKGAIVLLHLIAKANKKNGKESKQIAKKYACC